MKEKASEYNSYGLSVLPVNEDKMPALRKSWHDGFTPDEFNSTDRIAIICGKKSGGLECLDFDNHQGDAKERIKDFVENAKSIFERYPLVVSSTMSGGYHVVYRCEFIEGNLKLASTPVKDDKGRYKPDTVIETRGQGGYFVAAPSQGYKVIRGDYANIPTISKEDREELFELARSYNTWHEKEVREYEIKDRPGDLYNQTPEALNDVKNCLSMEGWVQVNGYKWRRPGKQRGYSATLGKVHGNCFYVFTDNAYPFEKEKVYSPFQVVSILQYGGDFSAFARELASKHEPKLAPKIEKIAPKSLLEKARIDLTKKIEKPPVVLEVKEVGVHDVRMARLFTLGNFSAITGKAKSKKTFLMGIFASSLINNRHFSDKFVGRLPDNKPKIVYFDTEQGDYDVYNTAKRISYLSGTSKHFEMYQLREFTPLERCDMVEERLKDKDVGFAVIDGIADLASAVNDEEEATRVVSLLLRWTKQYNCHIVNVIHQNKGNDFATGWLGSSIMKKAEIIISVTKDKEDNSRSIVSCDLSRGADFADFAFGIDEKGMPYLGELENAPEMNYDEPF